MVFPIHLHMPFILALKINQNIQLELRTTFNKPLNLLGMLSEHKLLLHDLMNILSDPNDMDIMESFKKFAKGVLSSVFGSYIWDIA